MHWTRRARIGGNLAAIESGRVVEAVAFALLGASSGRSQDSVGFIWYFLLFLFGSICLRRLVTKLAGVEKLLARSSLAVELQLRLNPVWSRSCLLAILTGLLWAQPLGVTSWLLTGLSLAQALVLAFGGGLLVLDLHNRIHPLEPALDAELNALVPRPVKILTISTEGCNAFANPLTQRIYFISGLLKLLTREQLKAVFLHEHAHLSESIWMQAGRMLKILVQSCVVLFFPIFNSWGPVAAGLLVAAIVLTGQLADAASRAAEVRADTHGSGQDPSVLATALEKICETNLFPAHGVAGTHPDLWSRMISAGIQPAWDRPAPAWRRPVVLAVQIAVAAGAFWFLRPEVRYPRSEQPAQSPAQVYPGFRG